MTRLHGVPASRIKAVWPKVLPFVQSALAHGFGRYTPISIRNALLSRDMQLQVVEDDDRRIIAVCVTEIRTYPAKRVGTIFLCAGKGMQRWLHHLSEIEQWMKDKGCQEVDLYGRPGWSKMLPDYQYARVLLRKEL